MLHKKCEGGGGGGVKVCYFLTTSRGARVFFPTLKTFLSFPLQYRILFYEILVLQDIFSCFFYPRPLTFVMVHPLCPANYSVSLPESVGMRSHLMGVVKPVAQGWGYSKGTLSSQSL